jgi:regulation of enolase protein 1 (concanavalin A-like superfamily)
VATGTASFRMNFWEVNGKGLSPTTRPYVTITAPTDLQAVEPGTSTLTAEATDAENDVTAVEFFVDGVSVGVDDTAPYSVDWTETEEDYYVVHALATNSAGLTKASRKVRFTVGEFGVRPPWTTFGNTQPEATFDQLGDNFKVSAAGSDVWQGTNQYGAVYLPGGLPDDHEAVVKVASFDGTHPSSKAGVMIRNDISQSANSPGYMVFAEKGNGETEFMHDAGGNGQVNNAGEPVATGCGTGSQPNWLKVRRQDNVFTVWCSRDGAAWTQVGSPTLIASAAATQDIGLFVVSHISGTLATAEFSDWSLGEIEPGPDPDPEEPAPACAPLRSDEFTGTAVNTARWTTVRGTPTVGGGSVILPIINGDIDGANAGAISYLGQAAPAGAWTATTKVTLEQDNEWQYAGLLLHVDDDNYSKLAFTKHSNDSRFLEFWSETGGSRTGHGGNVTVPAAFGNTVYVRLAASGTQLTASWSADGDTWTPIGTGPLKTGAKIGPVAAGDTDAENKTAAFDWFRITPDDPPADPGLRRRVRGRRARRLPLGQDQGLEVEQSRGGRRQARDHDVRRRHQRRQQRRDPEPHPPDPARGRLDGRDEDDGAAEGQLAAGRLPVALRPRPLRQVRRRGGQRAGPDAGAPRRAALRERRQPDRPLGRRPGPATAGERHGHVVAAPDQDRQHVHGQDQRRRSDLGGHARLRHRRADRPGPRRDGDRPQPERRPHRRHVRLRQAGRGGGEHRAGDHLRHGDPELGRRPARGRVRGRRDPTPTGTS